MMLAVRPNSLIIRNDMSSAIGSVTIATSALWAWKRKMIVTSATIIDSSMSFPLNVRIAAPIKVERS